jgi:hypothetical protein
LLVVRRSPWCAVSVVIAAAAAALGGCSSGATGPGGVQVDTVQATTPFTGTMTNTFGVTNFFGGTEIDVGDIDSTNPGVTERGVVTFNVILFEADTLTSAILRVDECNVHGAPFASLGQVLLESVVPGTPPGSGQNLGPARASFGVIAPDTTTGFKYANVTSEVANDVADSSTYVQFRFRESIMDGNNNGVSDYVAFRTNTSGSCTGDSTRAPILIITTH